MPKKPRLGRPPLRDADRRKHIMSIRVRPKLHALLQQAADKAGRTLSQEVEFRIEVTFLREVQFAEIADHAIDLVDKMEERMSKTRQVLENAKADLEKFGAKVDWEIPK
jgi:TraY domain